MFHLARREEQVSGLIRDLLGFGLGAILRASGELASTRKLVALGPIVDGHIGAELKQTRRISFDAVGVAICVGKAASCVNFGSERILSDRYSFHGSLEVEASEGDVRILAGCNFQSLRQGK